MGAGMGVSGSGYLFEHGLGKEGWCQDGLNDPRRVRSVRSATKRGIRIGSTEAAVRKAYGSVEDRGGE